LIRLDSVLDSFYVLGALWGIPTGPQVCVFGFNAPLSIAHETVWSPSTAAVTAFVGVNVVPMDTERVLANHTVLVEDGRITALGPSAQVKIPAGAVRVDGRGQYLMPGLADMHFGPSHRIGPPSPGDEQGFADRMFLRYVAYGVTTLRSVGGSSPSAVPQLRRLAAEWPVPRLYLALDGIPQLPWSQPDSVTAALAAVKAQGYSHVVGQSPADARALDDARAMAALRQAGLPLATHSHGLPFAQVLKLGASGGSAEHLYVFWDSLLGMPGPAGQTLDYVNGQRPPVHLPLAKVPALVAAVQRAGVWITPSLKCTQSAHPYIQGDGLAQLVKAMQDGGVKMLLGGDGWALSRWSVHSELIALVRAGLTPYQALVTGTRNVAEYFHARDSLGTVAVGQRADLVLLSGNPLQDIRHTRAPAGVMLAGRWFDRAALDQRLLAAPRVWFEELLRFHLAEPSLREFLSYLVSPPRTNAQWDELERRSQRVFALADSLEGTHGPAYGRVLPLIAAELGGIRAVLTPDQHEAFDVNLQVWLREQARKGHRVTVPGVASTP
jgi:imidazolonepropionase-like amidohydrolase